MYDGDGLDICVERIAKDNVTAVLEIERWFNDWSLTNSPNDCT